MILVVKHVIYIMGNFKIKTIVRNSVEELNIVIWERRNEGRKNKKFKGPETYLHQHLKKTSWLRELKPGLCNDLERWDGEADGREFQERGGTIHVDVWQKSSTLKQLFFN